MSHLLGSNYGYNIHVEPPPADLLWWSTSPTGVPVVTTITNSSNKYYLMAKPYNQGFQPSISGRLIGNNAIIDTALSKTNNSLIYTLDLTNVTNISPRYKLEGEVEVHTSQNGSGVKTFTITDAPTLLNTRVADENERVWWATDFPTGKNRVKEIYSDQSAYMFYDVVDGYYSVNQTVPGIGWVRGGDLRFILSSSVPYPKVDLVNKVQTSSEMDLYPELGNNRNMVYIANDLPNGGILTNTIIATYVLEDRSVKTINYNAKLVIKKRPVFTNSMFETIKERVNISSKDGGSYTRIALYVNTPRDVDLTGWYVKILYPNPAYRWVNDWYGETDYGGYTRDVALKPGVKQLVADIITDRRLSRARSFFAMTNTRPGTVESYIRYEVYDNTNTVVLTGQATLPAAYTYVVDD